jgi:tRNA(fMet)-specific endonuclease VapC
MRSAEAMEQGIAPDPGQGWMAEFQRGDDAAFERIVVHYGNRVLAFFRRYGADRSAHPKANHARIDTLVAEIECLDFDLRAAGLYGRLRAAGLYGRLRAALEAAGKPIGPNDMLIAAHALSKKLTLVTDNVGEFRRVKGLRVENWRR